MIYYSTKNFNFLFKMILRFPFLFSIYITKYSVWSCNKIHFNYELETHKVFNIPNKLLKKSVKFNTFLLQLTENSFTKKQKRRFINLES